MPADPAPVPLLGVHPVDAAVGYGEWDARYGHFRNGHVHEGQDVFAPAGTPLLAVRDGVVVQTGSGDDRGNWLAIYSPAFDETAVYLHMLHPTPRTAGDPVSAGERVGSLGCTGSCDGDHLHFEV